MRSDVNLTMKPSDFEFHHVRSGVPPKNFVFHRIQTRTLRGPPDAKAEKKKQNREKDSDLLTNS